MTVNMKKLMEQLDDLDQSEQEALLVKFEEELDTLLNNYWGFAERLNDDTEDTQAKLEAILQSYGGGTDPEPYDKDFASTDSTN